MKVKVAEKSSINCLTTSLKPTPSGLKSVTITELGRTLGFLKKPIFPLTVISFPSGRIFLTYPS